jgi:hypothetical protein
MASIRPHAYVGDASGVALEWHVTPPWQSVYWGKVYLFGSKEGFKHLRPEGDAESGGLFGLTLPGCALSGSGLVFLLGSAVMVPPVSLAGTLTVAKTF